MCHPVSGSAASSCQSGCHRTGLLQVKAHTQDWSVVVRVHRERRGSVSMRCTQGGEGNGNCEAAFRHSG